MSYTDVITITISGRIASGKTTIMADLINYLESKGHNIVIDRHQEPHIANVRKVLVTTSLHPRTIVFREQISE